MRRLLILTAFIYYQPLVAGDIDCDRVYSGAEEVVKVQNFSQDNIKISHGLKECKTTLTEDKVNAVFSQLIENYFQDLKEIKLSVSYFKDDAYFFEAGYGGFGGLFCHAKNRDYSIRVNEAFISGEVCPPPVNALRSIMAYELVHIRDYITRGFGGMLGLGLNYTRKKQLGLMSVIQMRG